MQHHSNKNPNIKIDSRERRSGLPDILMREKINIEIINNQSTDYIINNSFGVERKAINDFLKSIIDTRFFNQVRSLKTNFKSSLVILEGGGLYLQRTKVHPNCIRGVIIWTCFTMNIPIIRTLNTKDTAKYLIAISKRVNKREVMASPRYYKAPKPKTKNSHPLNSIPGIGPSTSKKLLKNFNSINQIANLPIEEIAKIQGIGKTRAKQVKIALN